MQKTRIGINALFLVPGDVGGTEIYLRKTLVALAGLLPPEEIIIFTTMDNDLLLRSDLEEFSFIKFLRLPFRAARRPMRIIMEQSLLPLLVIREKIHVLWSPGYTAPKWCLCPQVVTIPDLQYKSYPEDMSFLERRTLDYLVRTASRKAACVLTISEFSRREVVHYNFAPEKRIFPVHLGVEDTFGDTPDVSKINDLPSSLTWRPGKPFILCVAHTYPHKNIHLLVSAYARIQHAIPHDLVLVGKPRRGEDLVQQSLTEVGEAARVQRLCGLSFETMKYLFKNADLFVLPSLYEGFGLPILEAMKAGTLVITSRNAAIPEIGLDTVLYCEPMTVEGLAQSITNALEMPREKKEALISKARERSSRFTWEKTARETLHVLRKVIET